MTAKRVSRRKWCKSVPRKRNNRLFQRGNARSTLGLPDRVTDIKYSRRHQVPCINNAPIDGGYDPKIHFDTINDLLDLLKIRTPRYDGIGIDELTPKLPGKTRYSS